MDQLKTKKCNYTLDLNHHTKDHILWSALYKLGIIIHINNLYNVIQLHLNNEIFLLIHLLVKHVHMLVFIKIYHSDKYILQFKINFVINITSS